MQDNIAVWVTELTKCFVGTFYQQKSGNLQFIKNNGLNW